MIVITLTDCPISLRGDLTKWLIEINTGVFVGKVSARVRDNLWKRVVQNVKNGRATLVYSTNNEQRMDFRIHHSENEIIDFDGLKLVMKPSPSRTKKLTKQRMGFSKAGKMRMARRRQNSSARGTTHQLSFSYPSDYVVVDVETSGLRSVTHEIIEVGMLKVARNEIVETFHELIKPTQRISSQIEILTGITNELLEQEGKQLNEVLPNIKNFIGKSALLGHNVKFDIEFLQQAYSHNGYSALENRWYDTMEMYAKFLNGRRASKKLMDIATACNVPANQYHRALTDCYTAKAVYDVLREKIKK